MKITRVKYGITSNLGDEESEYIELEAQVGEHEDWQSVHAEVKKLVLAKANLEEKYIDLSGNFNKARNYLSAIKHAFRVAESNWENIRNVLIAHGVPYEDLSFPDLEPLEKAVYAWPPDDSEENGD